jgi:hypothetical protein
LFSKAIKILYFIKMIYLTAYAYTTSIIQCCSTGILHSSLFF